MDAGKQRAVALAAERIRRQRRSKLHRFKPYPKQYEFIAAGKDHRERLFMAGNQDGKTFTGAHEVAYHLTGLYPDWWPGRKFSEPILCWTGQTTNEKSKEIIQPALLGTDSSNMKDAAFGTGAIPHDEIVKVTTRQAGVKECVDVIVVKHYTNGVFDGHSRCVLKTYEQGREVWQGKPVHVIWSDEECPADVYSEAVTRTQKPGGVVLVTFTPMKGLTDTVLSFTQPEPGSPPKSITSMTHYDCCGGTWREDTPWAGEEWEGHYTKERVDEIIASYPPHEKETRAFGVPMIGIGRVLPFEEREYTCDPFEIPWYFARVKGCDFGWNHPGAGCELAIDRSNGKIYVVSSYRKRKEYPIYHAFMLQRQRPWVPIAWPHDGLNAGPSGGLNLFTQYVQHGANMMHISARYEDDKGGKQDPEPSILQIAEMIRLGDFKIFRDQVELLEEIKFYHRDDKQKIVPNKDDIISAMRYAFIMRRYARVEQMGEGNSAYSEPILSMAV